MSKFQLERICELMSPEPGNPNEAEGVLNPAAVRGPDGELYIFPRLVGKGNYSRIGMARVHFDDAGNPYRAERLGVVLEPEAEFELRPGGGGCEDPRVTYMQILNHYTMTYVALGPNGPRIALAVSEDLFKWERIGLVTFDPYKGIEFTGVDDKDSCLFPVGVPDWTGAQSLALVHRPLFPGTSPEEKAGTTQAEEDDLRKESIWLSYRDIDVDTGKPSLRGHFTSHRRLAKPEAAWEELKIGVGAPPMLCRHGWLVIYHGVCEIPTPDPVHSLQYAAGVMILDKDEPCKILYRSPEPILTPDLPAERIGAKGNVVFPTGIDRRDDIGQPDRFDVYYGMADDRIGVARLYVPEQLPVA